MLLDSRGYNYVSQTYLERNRHTFVLRDYYLLVIRILYENTHSYLVYLRETFKQLKTLALGSHGYENSFIAGCWYRYCSDIMNRLVPYLRFIRC